MCRSFEGDEPSRTVVVNTQPWKIALYTTDVPSYLKKSSHPDETDVMVVSVDLMRASVMVLTESRNSANVSAAAVRKQGQQLNGEVLKALISLNRVFKLTVALTKEGQQGVHCSDGGAHAAVLLTRCLEVFDPF